GGFRGGSGDDIDGEVVMERCVAAAGGDDVDGVDVVAVA
ncbi:hypothetical protein Tco_1177966, partial [Tanacetum coccineum]